jgi:hypothetical protein
VTITITIDESKIGDVLARDGRIVELRYVVGRNKGPAGYLDRLFGLADTANAGNGAGKTLYQVDVDSPLVIPASPDSTVSHLSLLISNTSIPYTELRLSHCPSGATFELDVN